MSVSWYLSDIGKAQGLQDLFARQSPQRLKVLREHAIAQSAVSSNRIEGVEIERLIEDNKERYYETLRQSSLGWHDGKHDPWPYIGYLLFIVKKAYDEFTARAGELAAPRGEKSEIVMAAIQRKTRGFVLAEIEKECPGVGRDWIRTILFQMKKDGKVTCSGKGKAARWTRVTK